MGAHWPPSGGRSVRPPPSGPTLGCTDLSWTHRARAGVRFCLWGVKRKRVDTVRLWKGQLFHYWLNACHVTALSGKVLCLKEEEVSQLSNNDRRNLNMATSIKGWRQYDITKVANLSSSSHLSKWPHAHTVLFNSPIRTSHTINPLMLPHSPCC